MPSEMKITEEDTIEEDSEVAYLNTEVMEEKDTNQDLDLNLYPEEDF